MKAAFTLLVLLCVVPVFAAEKTAPPKGKGKEQIVVLEPMKVTGSPILSYAIDIVIYSDPDTKRIARVFITRVWEDSDAEDAGIMVGDEIVKIDGKSVREFEALVSVESPLGKLFLNRKPGEPLKLELMTRRPEKVTLRARHPSLTDFTR